MSAREPWECQHAGRWPGPAGAGRGVGHGTGLGVGVRGDQGRGAVFRAGRAGPGPAAGRLPGSRDGLAGPRRGLATARRLARHRGHRGAVVRRVHGGAQLGRASRGRGHGRDGGQHRPGGHRGAGRLAAAGGLSAPPAGRAGRGVRRGGGRRAVGVRWRERIAARCGHVPARGRVLRHRGGGPEARAAARVRVAGHHVRLFRGDGWPRCRSRVSSPGRPPPRR